MKIGVIGAGYVGLVTGVCLAEMGNTVTICDIDQKKIDKLRQGKSPHFEPGLNDLLERNITEERVVFSTSASDAAKGAQAVFLAVGTPPREDGTANLEYIEKAAADVAKNIDCFCVIINKSTVPVGTCKRITDIVAANTSIDFSVVSNPEFLKEGSAIEDFMKPDRVVIGSRCEKASQVMRMIYAPFLRSGHPLLEVSPESSEMIKYASNSLLALKISFMNEVANICSAAGADVEDVRRGVGMDQRIGKSFLFPGLGYGGSCFPKDVRALSAVAQQFDIDALICEAISEVNDRQYSTLLRQIETEFGAELSGKTFAIWGLAFKPKTDDIREAPALKIIHELCAAGAKVKGFDPEAMENAGADLADLGDSFTCASNTYDACDGADALIICTEWNEFRSPDFDRVCSLLKNKLIFDGRNLYNADSICGTGIKYYSVGRSVITG